MQSLSLQIIWQPASIHKNTTFLILFVEVSEEWSDNLNTLLSIFGPFNLELFGKIKDASDLDLLERKLVLEIIKTRSF